MRRRHKNTIYIGSDSDSCKPVNLDLEKLLNGVDAILIATRARLEEFPDDAESVLMDIEAAAEVARLACFVKHPGMSF